MGGVDRKGGATLRIWKRGAWTKRGDYSYKGGTCDPLGNHVRKYTFFNSEGRNEVYCI